MQVVNKADIFEGGALGEEPPQDAPQHVPCNTATKGRGSEKEPASSSCSSQAQGGGVPAEQLLHSSVGDSRLPDSCGARVCTMPGHEPAAELGPLQGGERARPGSTVVTSTVTGEGLDNLLLEIDRKILSTHPLTYWHFLGWPQHKSTDAQNS